MKFIKSRLPEKTELLKVFWLLLIYSNSFGFIAYAKQVNLLITMFDVWDLLGILGYVFMVSALEAGTVILLLTIWSMILPNHLFREKFVQWAVFWFVAITLIIYPVVVPISSYGLDEFKTPILDSGTLLPFLKVWLLFMGLLLILKWMLNKQWLETKFNLLIDRVSILGKFYLILDSIGFILVITRNIFQFR